VYGVKEAIVGGGELWRRGTFVMLRPLQGDALDRGDVAAQDFAVMSFISSSSDSSHFLKQK
jgi:hypothetical protein